MSTTTIGLLLQITTSLLLGVQHNAQLPLSARENVVSVAGQAIQLSTQALAPVDFPVAQNESKWPTITDLLRSPYLDTNGKWVPLGQSVQLQEGDISFGDMNNDGFDDAAVVVKRINNAGNPSFALAVLLNQGGILFNIADFPMSASTTIYAHSILSDELTMDMQVAGQARATSRYELLGNTIVKL